ncbi:PREDICTED: uncharacterized protein LOC108560566 [Nicrophorus vespilloides]|uniref:Regulatory protein zeste n=1 Tax=Nicrophorus vespilloides TaxID=110193 RepID=A0ABM1MGG6_NICVS|nr:PREDICTED: uncharacterized protein LOC108560566 [Nicrophorus vespilloides]
MMEIVKPKRERSANFSPEEINTLVNIAFKYKDIIENKATNAIVWNRKDKIWKIVTAEFNDQMLINRTTKTLRNKYECLKVQLRKKSLRNKYEMDKCNGKNIIPFEDFEEKLFAMQTMGIDGIVDEESDIDVEFMMSEGYQNEEDYSSFQYLNKSKEQTTKLPTLLTKDCGNSRKLLKKSQKEIKYERSLSEKLSKLADLRKELLALQIKVASKKVHMREQELLREKELFIYKKKLLHYSMRNEKLKDDARYWKSSKNLDSPIQMTRIPDSANKRRLRDMEAFQMCLDDFPTRSKKITSNKPMNTYEEALVKVKNEVDENVSDFKTDEIIVKQENSDLGIDRKAQIEEAENAQLLRRNIMEDEIKIKLEIDEDVDDEKDNFEFVDVRMTADEQIEQMDPVPNLFINKSDLEEAIADKRYLHSRNTVLNLKIEKE